jgi:hypothetical protein
LTITDEKCSYDAEISNSEKGMFHIQTMTTIDRIAKETKYDSSSGTYNKTVRKLNMTNPGALINEIYSFAL